MKAKTIKQLKDELAFQTKEELTQLALHLARFKKENKELLTYLLFESHNEEAFVLKIKAFITDEFNNINTRNFYYVRKSIRKILSAVKKYIRYSKNKETEAELLLHFCKTLKEVEPSFSRSTRLQNVFDTQLRMAKNAILKLHEDLQYDLLQELNSIKDE